MRAKHGRAGRFRFERLEPRLMLAITVNTLVDELDGSIADGDISLRDAIAAAAAGETIDFSVAGTIVLTLGELLIDKNLTINGPGAELLTIDASGNDETPGEINGDGSRIFNIDDDLGGLSSVTIAGLKLTGGDTSDPGGAILAREDLALVDCIITDNATTSGGIQGGGGIFSQSLEGPANSLTVINSMITNNTSLNFEGGGIRKRSGRLEIRGSIISGNSASDGGGGVSAAEYVEVLIVDSTISGNTATGIGTTFDGGGGLFLWKSTAIVSSSTISGNSQINGRGGGIYNFSSALAIVNSTISGNSSTDSGGGIYVRAGSLTIRNATITDNTADANANGSGAGGGIHLANGSAAFIEQAIIAGNFDHSGTAPDLVTPAESPAGAVTIRFSLIGDNTGSGLAGAPVGSPDANGNLVGDPSGAGVIDPLLGPLADNGGPTKTHALLFGSPAINAGDPNRSGTNLVMNGGFELPPGAPEGGFNFYRGGTNLFGWQVGGHSVDVHHTGHTAAHSGIQSLDSSGVEAGSITQVIATTPGKTYVLEFWYSAHVFHPYQGDAMLEVRWGDEAVDTVSHATPPNSQNMGWTFARFVITANSAATALSFVSLSQNGGIVLDDITLVELGESATGDVDQRGGGFPRTNDGRTDMGAVEFPPVVEFPDVPTDPAGPDGPTDPPADPPVLPAPPSNAQVLLLVVEAAAKSALPSAERADYGTNGYVMETERGEATSARPVEVIDAALATEDIDETVLLQGFLDFVDPEVLDVELGDEPPPQVAAQAHKPESNQLAQGGAATGSQQGPTESHGEHEVAKPLVSAEVPDVPIGFSAALSYVAARWKWMATTSGVLLLAGAAWKSRESWLRAARRIRVR